MFSVLCQNLWKYCWSFGYFRVAFQRFRFIYDIWCQKFWYYLPRTTVRLDWTLSGLSFCTVGALVLSINDNYKWLNISAHTEFWILKSTSFLIYTLMWVHSCHVLHDQEKRVICQNFKALLEVYFKNSWRFSESQQWLIVLCGHWMINPFCATTCNIQKCSRNAEAW